MFFLSNRNQYSACNSSILQNKIGMSARSSPPRIKIGATPPRSPGQRKLKVILPIKPNFFSSSRNQDTCRARPDVGQTIGLCRLPTDRHNRVRRHTKTPNKANFRLRTPVARAAVFFARLAAVRVLTHRLLSPALAVLLRMAVTAVRPLILVRLPPGPCGERLRCWIAA